MAVTILGQSIWTLGPPGSSGQRPIAGGIVFSDGSRPLDVQHTIGLAVSGEAQRLRGINITGVVLEMSQKASEDECAAACKQRAGAPPCTGWSFCGDPKKCTNGSGYDAVNTCLLKDVPDLTRPNTSSAGSNIGWTSGLVASHADVPSLLRARGLEPLSSSTLTLGLRNTTLTLEVISPKDNPSFNFVHALDSLTKATRLKGFHHLGDVTFRVPARPEATAFRQCSTVNEEGDWKDEPVAARRLTDAPSHHLFPVDVSRQLQSDCKHVSVQRWLEIPELAGAATSGGRTSSSGDPWLPGEVHLWYRIGNLPDAGKDLTLGSLGLSMPMDQYFKDLRLEQVAVQASFVEAYQGGQYGYMQVTRASGRGPVLLVLPMNGTSFEAWRPLRGEDVINREMGFTVEGTNQIMVHSDAYAKLEWKHARPWVAPTSRTLAPGESALYGLRLVLAPGPQQVESTLLSAGHPVVIGVPGFTLHTDMQHSRLMLRLPSSLHFSSVAQEPEGALLLQAVPSPTAQPPGTQLISYRVRAAMEAGGEDPVQRWSGCQWGDYERAGAVEEGGAASPCPCFVGRVRLRLRFHSVATNSSLEQVVQLLLVPPARTLVAAFGQASSDPQRGWLPASAGDPWGRGPAFMGVDNELQSRIMDEKRVFISGLSDEAGFAQPVAMAIKQLDRPVAEEIEKLEAYVHETLWQAENQTDGQYLQDRENHGVRASLFYYDKNNAAFRQAQPKFMEFCDKAQPWWLTCWDLERSKVLWRGANYPHAATMYWVLYRLARMHSPPLATRAPWEWYLKQSAMTLVAMWRFGEHFARWGLMEGSGFPQILDDVIREGLQKEGGLLNQVLQKRIDFWQRSTFPHGSEMPWDNTGQEEIYTWMNRIGDKVGADTTLQAILAYDALYPHWGLSGSARRWWDFWINGKTDIGIGDRGLHHYAAPLNAVPLMLHYRQHPDQLFFLRLATAGLGGSVANIKPSGFPSMGFHADPSLLKLDGYSADWGVGFYGYCTQVTSVLTCDAHLGWLCFNCDITDTSPTLAAVYQHPDHHPCSAALQLRIQPRDAPRTRLFVSLYHLSVRVEGASVADVTVDTTNHTVVVRLEDVLPPAAVASATGGDGGSGNGNSSSSSRGRRALVTLERGGAERLFNCTVPSGAACVKDTQLRRDVYMFQTDGVFQVRML